MPNCYVSVMFERQPNPDEAVEAKGGKKKASKNRAQEAVFRGTRKEVHVYSLSEFISGNNNLNSFLVTERSGSKDKKLSILMVMTMLWTLPFRTPELEQRIREGTVPHHIPPTTHTPDGVDTILGGKHCKCGSTTHQRISHRDCPLKKTK